MTRINVGNRHVTTPTARRTPESDDSSGDPNGHPSSTNGTVRQWSGRGEENVYRVACRIFRQRGYHGTSMRAIAAELGMQPAALYYYFSSKDDLLFNIMETGIRRLTAYVRENLDTSAAASTQLRQAMQAHITAITEHLDELTVFLHELKSLPSGRQVVIIERRDEYERIFRDIVARGIESGEFRCVDRQMAGMAILSACNWLYTWYEPGGRLPGDRVAEEFAGLFLRGLLTDPA